MTWITLVNGYVTVHLLLLVVAGIVAALRALDRRRPSFFPYRQQLAIAHALTLTALVLPVVMRFWRHPAFLPPTAQIWSAPTMKGWSGATASASQATILLTAAPSLAPVSVASQAAMVAFCLGALVLALRVARDAAALRRITRSAYVLRRRGKLAILVARGGTVPFAFWLPRRYVIVVPPALVTRRAELSLVLRHEAQHHRQHDTKWLYLYQALRALFFWNPAAHALARAVSDLQEFACDEALAGHRGVSPQAYCRCLLWVADLSLSSHRSLVGTASMARGEAGTSLKRRIEVMLKRPTVPGSKAPMLAAAAASVALLVATAYAAPAAVHDRRITAADAQRWLEVAQGDSGFPLVVNDLVLEQLNRYLGTPDGRDFIKSSLAQMANFREQVGQRLADYHVPMELLALPIVESGYRNRTKRDDPLRAAGLWQFMPETARNFGLRVDAQVDERLDVGVETDAAVRLLASLDLQFKDWGLALLGYNGGQHLVEKAIRETGSRDAWELIRRGYEGDPHYVASVMAAVLIMKNPSALD